MNLQLPHWAQLLVAFLVVAGTWVVQQNAAGNLVLPAAALTALTVILTALGMLSGSALKSKQLTNGK